MKGKWMQSRMSAGKTEEVSRLNGTAKCKRVSFGNGSDSLILF